jgi:hypothetical protein
LTADVIAGTNDVMGVVNTKIGDAPSDGSLYVRKDAEWAVTTKSTELDWFIDAYTNTFTVREDDEVTIERTIEDPFIEGVYTNLVEYFMRIEIPLNPGGYPGTWSDFELKISFVTNSVEDFHMVYYYQTMGDPWDDPYTNAAGQSFGDTDSRVYYTDDYNVVDVRQWLLYEDTLSGVVGTESLTSRLINPLSVIDTVIVFPSHNGCGIPWETWQWYQNAQNLRASYVRYDGTDPELNATKSLQRWHPVTIDWVPVRKSELPLGYE